MKDEHYDQGVAGRILPRGKSIYPQPPNGSKGEPRHQQFDQNEHKKCEPFRETENIPRCECGGRIRPHICWFGEVPFGLDRIFRTLDECTIFMAVGTSGVVEPAASFVAHVRGPTKAIYVGPEEPDNASTFTECHLGKAGEVLPKLFAQTT